MISDHPFMGNITTNTGNYFASQTYFFISLPGIILGMKGFSLITKATFKRFCNCKSKCERIREKYCWKVFSCLGHFLHSLLVLSLAMIVIFVLFLISYAVIQEPSFYLAIFTFLVITNTFTHGVQPNHLTGWLATC